MLRTLLTGCGALLVLIGAGLLTLRHDPAGLGPLVFGLLLLLSLVLERRYKPAQTSGEGRPTGERFVDPTTGELMEVWYDPATGERSYVRVEKR